MTMTTMTTIQEAESCVIGSVLQEAVHRPANMEIARHVFDLLKPNDFCQFHYQAIYQVTQDVYYKSGIADIVEVKRIIENNPAFDELYIVNESPIDILMECCENTPTFVNGKHYAKIVKEASAKRQLQALTEDIQSGLSNGSDAASVMTHVQDRITNIKLSSRPSTATPLDQMSVDPLTRQPISGWLGDFIQATSDNLEVPCEMSMGVILGILAVSSMGKYQVNVKPGYNEQLALWVCCCMPPGTMKSAMLDRARQPILNGRNSNIKSLPWR